MSRDLIQCVKDLQSKNINSYNIDISNIMIMNIDEDDMTKTVFKLTDFNYN